MLFYWVLSKIIFRIVLILDILYLALFFVTRFQWRAKDFPPELSISPSKGYICPGMEVPFEVTFSPEELSNDLRYENLSCFVEGSSSPVTLTVTGSCIVAPTSKEVCLKHFTFFI